MNIKGATECSECGTDLTGVEGAAPAPAAPGAPAPVVPGAPKAPGAPAPAAPSAPAAATPGDAANASSPAATPPAPGNPAVARRFRRVRPHPPCAATSFWNIRFVHLLLVEAVFQFATYLLNPGDLQLRGAAGVVAGRWRVRRRGWWRRRRWPLRPFTGWIADKLSKTTLLVLAAALFTVAAFGCAAVSSVFWIGVFRIVQGVAFAFRSAVVVSLASVVVAHDHVGRAVGWVGVVTTVSCAVAPTLAAFMGTTVGYHACFFVSGSLFFVGLVLAVLFKLPKDVRTHHRAAQEQAREAKGRVPAGFRRGTSCTCRRSPIP